MSASEAFLRGLVAMVVIVAGVLGLAALEALLLFPERGVLSMFARGRAQMAGRSSLAADGLVGLGGMIVALLGPALAAAFLATSSSLAGLASSALLLALPAPVLLALGTGRDAGARLALHDGLAQLLRRSLALIAVVIVAPPQDATVSVVVVACFAAVVLVRSRNRGAPTAQPRFDDRLAGPALLCFRGADRALVVVVAALAGTAVAANSGLWIAFVVTALVVVAVGVIIARALGPLRGEGVLGPLLLLSVAGLGRVLEALLS